MALGTPALATPTVGTAGTADQTVDFTPTLGALLVTLASSRSGVLHGALALTPSALSWTPLATALHDLGSSTRIRAAAWAAIASSAAALNVRVDSASATKTCVSVVEITGPGGIPGNFAGAADPGGTANPTVTLGSAPAASSTVIGYFAAAGATAVTAPAGYTEIGETVSDSDLIVEIVYDALSAATSAAWTTANARGVGLLIEVVEASGAARILRPRSNRFKHMIIR